MTPRQIWILTVTCLGVGLVMAANAALNTGLPGIAISTGATQAQLTWIVDGYTLVLACLLLPAGAIGDKFSRRGALQLGLFIFTLATLAPVWLDSPTQLIICRSIAGLGAAFVMPATLSLLTANFPYAQRAKAVGIWAAVAGSGAILGLLGTGLLLESWSWHSIFIGLAAMAVIAFALGWTVPSSREGGSEPLDWRGMLAVIGAIGLFVLGVIEAPIHGWLNPFVLICLALSVLSTTVFIHIELRVRHPLLDVKLFANHGFASSSASITLQFIGMFGLFFVHIQFMQLIAGYSALTSALWLMPFVVPLVALSVVSHWLVPLCGLRTLALAGLLICALGLLLLGGLHSDADSWEIVLPVATSGLGLGLCSAPATAAILSATPENKLGVASAVNDATREIGASLGIAISGSLLAAVYSREIAPAVEQVPEVAKQPVADSLASALEVAKAAGSQGDPLADFATEAFVRGMQISSYSLAAVVALGALLIALWSPGRNGRPFAFIERLTHDSATPPTA
ncbi:MAG: MFS transporter [Mycobacteriaceae bacterium]